MEYRITVTMTGYGRPDVAEDNVKRIFRAFEETHPEAEAIISTNGETGTLEISYAVEAPSAEEAIDRGRPIYANGMAKASITKPDEQHTIVRIEVELVTSDEPTAERELQPA